MTTRTSKFHKYLGQNKKGRETVFACLKGAQVKFLIKRGRKSQDIVPFMHLFSTSWWVLLSLAIPFPDHFIALQLLHELHMHTI